MCTYIIGSKMILYSQLFQQFNVVIVHIFNMVNTLDMVESGYSWT